MNLEPIAHTVKNYPADRIPSPGADTRPNILIVDDRKENLLATEKVLKNLDADIFKANSGNEAL
jgi:response regulator RpfG family c-di-GMP phosphodiesterase